jgi:hypothetical protein
MVLAVGFYGVRLFAEATLMWHIQMVACRMEGSAHLPTWVPRGLFTNSFGTTPFLDTSDLINPVQFYRAVNP